MRPCGLSGAIRAGSPKLALGALFSLLSMVVVGGILTQGYLLLLAERVARAEPQPLPEWDDFGEILRQGFSGLRDHPRPQSSR